MSYFLADSSGYIGDLASNNGLNELKSLLANNPIFDSLWEEGFLPASDEIYAALSGLEQYDQQNETLNNFIQLAKQCKDIIIISNGEYDDQEDNKPERVSKDDKLQQEGWQKIQKQIDKLVEYKGQNGKDSDL